jgi:hypothetical protein
MLHMGIACNLLASIGGQPRIVRTAPRYPTQLPLGGVVDRRQPGPFGYPGT